MQSRERISAATWVVVQDAHVSEDIFQNTVIKAVTKEVQFDAEAALLSWAMISARREGLDWLRKDAHPNREEPLIDGSFVANAR